MDCAFSSAQPLSRSLSTLGPLCCWELEAQTWAFGSVQLHMLTVLSAEMNETTLAVQYPSALVVLLPFEFSQSGSIEGFLFRRCGFTCFEDGTGFLQDLFEPLGACGCGLVRCWLPSSNQLGSVRSWLSGSILLILGASVGNMC